VVVQDADPEGPETDVRRYTSDDLYALIRYGLAYEDRTRLLEAHLPAHVKSATRPASVLGTTSRSPSERHWSARSSLWVPVILGLVLVLSAIAAVDPTGGTTAPFTTDHVDGREYLELRCVPVPVGVPADALLPRFSDTGTFRRGAWSEVPDPLGATTDRFRGSPLRTPERRAIAAYRGPDRHRYRVEVSRWRTDWIAANAADRAVNSTVRITWSYWSFDVHVISVTGEAVQTPVAVATAEGLLGTIDLAEKVRLHSGCTRQIGEL
ncbi:MAG: hypothetical protein R3324_11345, partial [Halobacteriales archaeon]|nr:hypothetical protein [Halobacteriales archaeon]